MIKIMNKMLVKPLVSVIIPTYNRANIIGNTLDSVVKQSYQKIEIIIVDDGSTDNTEEVIKAIGDSRIHYIKHQINYGGATARNTGIKAAKGEYIAFLDSDDIWLTNKIEIQLDAIQRHSYPEKVVSYTQVLLYDGKSYQEVSLCPKHPTIGKGEIEALADYLFCNNGFMQTSTLMMHISLARSTLFSSRLKIYQDWDFCLRLEVQEAIFVFIEQPLTIYNGEPRSDRISSLINYDLGFQWIKEYRSLISESTVRKFIYDYVIIYNNQLYYSRDISVFKNIKVKNIKVKKIIEIINTEIILLKALHKRLISFKDFIILTSMVSKHYLNTLKCCKQNFKRH
ncbi:MAG: glycosyltransferase family 2 protein [Chlorogloeopsis fritschii C42_A2020_084]|uniref:glycosyltransferase family 2 protein n=1 Tax=Chlorogloeopsis fritschii TaxID=1124 RepID=UPI001A0323A7|nr:glycosyltransferase family 2 protein [Chlorogloeopsis fritschii]MBF2004215.1 glycosyltransferase family 2 protein [Chlorogloeopsis fritschii C42_A2020_084]